MRPRGCTEVYRGRRPGNDDVAASMRARRTHLEAFVAEALRKPKHCHAPACVYYIYVQRALVARLGGLAPAHPNTNQTTVICTFLFLMSDAEKLEAVHPSKDAAGSKFTRDGADDPAKCERKMVTNPTPESKGPALALATQSRQIAQVTSHEDFAEAKKKTTKMKENIFVTARKDEEAPISPTVKILVGSAALLVVGLVFYIGYSLLRTDASLEDRIMSGDKAGSLRALKEHSIQNNFTIFVIVIVVLFLVMLAGFGYFIYFKDATKHEMKKTWNVVHCAEQAVDYNQSFISKLTGDVRIQTLQIDNLQQEVNRCSAELSKKDENNEEMIRKLKQQLDKKMAEISQAETNLKTLEGSLAEAKGWNETLDEDMKLQQDGTSNLRIRPRAAEKSEKEDLSTKKQLDAKKKVKEKNSRCYLS